MHTQRGHILSGVTLIASIMAMLIYVGGYVAHLNSTVIVEGTATIRIGNSWLEDQSFCVKSYKINDNIVNYVDMNSTKSLIPMDRVKSIKDEFCSKRVSN